MIQGAPWQEHVERFLGVHFVFCFCFLKEKVARGFRGSEWCGVRFRFVPVHRHFSSELGVM